MATLTTAQADTIWRAIDDQRTRTADLLEGLTPEEVDSPSLCDGWTVRHVAAHLTLQQLDLRSVTTFLARNPRMLGHLGLNATIHHSALIQAQRLSMPEIVARIRGMRGSRRHNAFVTPYDALSDVLVHSQDIAIPLGADLPMSREGAVVAASHLWAVKGSRLSAVYRRLPLADCRLRATDADWSRGSGPEVAGPVASLVLLLTGRRVALDQVAGEGAEILRAASARPR